MIPRGIAGIVLSFAVFTVINAACLLPNARTEGRTGLSPSRPCNPKSKNWKGKVTMRNFSVRLIMICALPILAGCPSATASGCSPFQKNNLSPAGTVALLQAYRPAAERVIGNDRAGEGGVGDEYPKLHRGPGPVSEFAFSTVRSSHDGMDVGDNHDAVGRFSATSRPGVRATLLYILPDILRRGYARLGDGVCVCVGLLRLVGLVINGGRKNVTPWIRACVGFLIFGGINYCFASSGVISTHGSHQ